MRVTAGASSSVRVRRSAPTRAIAFALPVALTGCPALQSDWTVSGSGAVDGSVDATGPDAAGGSSGSGNSGSSSGGSSGASGGSSSGGSSGGSGGSSSGGSGDGGPACLTDLSGVGTSDFRIAFTLTTTSTQPMALVSQIGSDCTAATRTYWDVWMNDQGGGIGGITAVTQAGPSATGVNIEVGVAVNDGKPHRVVVAREAGLLWYERDGVIVSAKTPDAYAFGTFPVLRVGTDTCSGAGPLAGHGTLTDLCITEGGTSGTDAGTCDVTDLSNVGTGDFRIDLDVSGVLGATPYALVNQRASCPPYNGWALYTSPTGAVELETDDGNGADRVFQIGGTGVNDGSAHHVAAWRSAGRIYVQVDATPTSPAVMDTNALGSLPPLVIGSDACTTAAAPLTGSLTGLCIGGSASTACLTDLSGVGAGDFSIHFTLTTTESVGTLGLLNQRAGCDDTSTFWDISLSPTGGVIAATNDGTHRVAVEAGDSLNDGKPHKVDVIRRGGKLWYASDGTIHSTPSPDPYSFGTFPPLVLGSSACTGTTPAAGHATISEVCITEP